jgi:magnesium chelatase subunit D
VFDLADDKSVSTPFGAVVGQRRLKQALLCVAADDGLDGLLVTGQKGTAKSTLVRGLAALLPDQRVVADCPYGCPPDDRSRQCLDCRDRATFPVETRPVPLVTLPLGASRDRVVGTLSVSDALAGEATFDPGLLARANRGLLYVDEVNLLDDHLVDVLLDAAASGVNRVERDGVSRSHPAEFTLVGTMNPEEGDLRPQLRDRFALSVEVEGERDVEDRVAIIDGDLRDSHPDGTDDDTGAHRERLRHARRSIESVALTDEQKREVAELCLEAGVDGHRADIATARAARALAALDERPTVTQTDIRTAASFALGHRMRSTPFEDAPDAEDVIDDHFEDGESEDEGDDVDAEGSEDAHDDSEAGGSEDGGSSEGSEGDDVADDDGDTSTGEDADGSDSEASPDDGGTPEDRNEGDPTPAEAGSDPSEEGDGSADERDGGDSDGDEMEQATPLVPGQSVDPAEGAAAPEVDAPEADGATGSGRAESTPSTGNNGVRVRTEQADGGSGIDAAASVRAAATRGHDRVESRDLRRSVRSGAGEALVVFAVDASASMRPAMAATKGVTLELLEDAYTERDSVSVVAFAGKDAEVLLPPTDSVTLAARHLKELPTGDRTPLPAGLRTTAEVIDRVDPDAAVAVVVSDGRANAAANPTADTRAAAEALAATGARAVCVEAGDERGLLAEVASTTDGTLLDLDALTADRVERELANSRSG